MRTNCTPDHYATLGLTPQASHTDIKRAFRTLAMLHHPDRDQASRSAERFHAIHCAYSTLSDPVLREAYDHGRTMRSRAAAAPPPVRMVRVVRPERPATRNERIVYRGLHATGLAFGLLLVLSVCAGITFLERSWAYLVLTLPGLVILPDSLAGLRRQE